MTPVLTAKTELTHDDIRQKETLFYRLPFYFSYSSLNRLLWNPAVFYQEYVLKIKEERTERHLLEGKVIHALLLSKPRFNKLFIVMPGKMPVDNTKSIIDKVFKIEKAALQRSQGPYPLDHYRPEILRLLQEMNLHQALADDKPAKNNAPAKSGDDKRMEKILSEEALKYWTFLHEKGTRDVVDQETVDFCTKAAEKIKASSLLMEQMGLLETDFSEVEVFNEQFLKCDLKNFPFGLQGVLDNLVMDHPAKVIRINDVKVIGKDLKDFPETVDYYLYWMQAVIYITLVLRNYPQLIDQGYEVQFRFVVLDRTHQIYSFPIRQQTIQQWISQFQSDCLSRAFYHYQRNYYVLPYEFAEGLVVL